MRLEASGEGRSGWGVVRPSRRREEAGAAAPGDGGALLSWRAAGGRRRVRSAAVPRPISPRSDLHLAWVGGAAGGGCSLLWSAGGPVGPAVDCRGGAPAAPSFGGRRRAAVLGTAWQCEVQQGGGLRLLCSLGWWCSARGGRGGDGAGRRDGRVGRVRCGGSCTMRWNRWTSTMEIVCVQCFGSARIRRCGGASGESPALTLGRCRQRRRHGVVLLEGVVVKLHYTTLRKKSLVSVG